MRYLLIFCLILALSGCQTTASGTNHNASILTNIFSMEF